MKDAAALLFRSPTTFAVKAARRSRRLLRRAVGPGVPPVNAAPVLLMYHRIADVDSDPWGLAVSPRNFREHLRVLAHEATCISVGELVHAAAAGHVPPRSVCLTFDDGYRDNLVHASAMLDEFSLPATFFVTSGYLEGHRAFWWDALEWPFFANVTIPERLALDLASGPVTFDFAGDTEYRDEAFAAHRQWRAGNRPLSKRHRAFLDVWQILQAVPPPERERLLETIRQWAPPAGADTRSLGQPMTPDEVRQLSSRRGIEIGGHTVTHPALAALDRDAQRREIFDNKRRLEELVGRPLRFFSYPHGSHTDETVSLLKDAGYEAAFINLAFTFEDSADLFRLPRVTVEDWTGEEFARRLKHGFADE
jgi:peptidoglycan/xylan/chitin deacetylase (PgdA/CDA1 family)